MSLSEFSGRSQRGPSSQRRSCCALAGVASMVQGCCWPSDPSGLRRRQSSVGPHSLHNSVIIDQRSDTSLTLSPWSAAGIILPLPAIVLPRHTSPYLSRRSIAQLFATRRLQPKRHHGRKDIRTPRTLAAALHIVQQCTVFTQTTRNGPYRTGTAPLTARRGHAAHDSKHAQL